VRDAKQTPRRPTISSTADFGSGVAARSLCQNPLTVYGVLPQPPIVRPVRGQRAAGQAEAVMHAPEVVVLEIETDADRCQDTGRLRPGDSEITYHTEAVHTPGIADNAGEGRRQCVRAPGRKGYCEREAVAGIYR